jgi:heme-degrading monooxygenase HmoA
MIDKATADRVYRIDKFVVPNQAREEFLSNVLKTHQLLKVQPGFIQGLILEQPAAEGEFNILTLVEWSDENAVEKAREVVLAMHKETGFNPQEARARLGIKVEPGSYKMVLR